tara:strand:- start:1867 stop:3432 length:1566 start_codon:yes stop_codon:yes gene_type:complete
MSGSYTLLVDWNNDGDFTDSNDDISGDTLSLSWSRGRDYASALQGRSVAGKLTATLINTEGKYSPSNTSSALTGNILPGRSIRLQAGSGSFPYTFPVAFNDAVRWQGKLDRIKPAPAAVGRKTATLTAFGTLGYLNQFETQLASKTNRRTDQAVGDILDDVGWEEADDRDLDTGQTTISRFWMSGKKTIDALRLVEEAEAGFIKESKSGQVAFENRYHRLTQTASTTSQATFSDADGAAHTFEAIAQADPLATIVNHVEATARKFNTASVGVLWTHPENGSDSPTLAPGETKVFVAEYPNPDAANSAMEVNLWTTPAATTDILANTASGGSSGDSGDKIADITITATKTAERMEISLANADDGSSIYLTKIQARGTAVSTKNPCIVRAIDTTSQGIYGERKYVAKTKFIPTTSEAQDWCDYQVSVSASPTNILTMTIPASAPGNIGQSLSRDLSDRITVTATGDAKLGVDEDFFIEGEKHAVTAGGQEHTTVWQLSPASGGYSQFWVLGVGVLGTSTVPAF